MPVFDLPLAQLQKYQGKNPCPPDMDSFWDQSLEEMKRVDPQVELMPASFQTSFAECFDLYFTGVRNARIHAKYLRPKNSSGPHPAILQFHGYSANSGDWNDKLNFVALGYSVAALDCRGQGGLSEDTGGVKGNTLNGQIIRGLDDAPENMLMRHIFLDATELARIVMDMAEVDPHRVGAMGASQGGGLTLACAALEPQIKRLTPMYPFLSDYLRVWEMDLATGAYAELREYLRRFDPMHLREQEIYTRLGYIDIQPLAKRIRGEVLMATGLMDTICPPSTQFAVYNKITAPKKLVVFPDYGHEGIPCFWDEAYQFFTGL